MIDKKVLYFIKEDGFLIYYESESVDELNHHRFEDWSMNIGL